MILPIVAYGDPILKKKTEVLEKEDLPEVEVLVEKMFETMYASNGVGLAAPQVGKSLRLFVIDSSEMDDDEPEGLKEVFINPQIISYNDEFEYFEEGCLSIPGIREKIRRPEGVKLSYYDLNLKKHTKEFHGVTARVIQHEYDHIEGVLFTDRLTPIKKRLLQRKLNKISIGKVTVNYKMKFPLVKKRGGLT